MAPVNTMLLGTTRVSLSNGISFDLTALAGCKGVIDRPTDRQRDRTRYGIICCNTRHYRFQQMPPKNVKMHRILKIAKIPTFVAGAKTKYFRSLIF